LAGKGFLAFIRRAISLEADSNVKREMRESFGERRVFGPRFVRSWCDVALMIGFINYKGIGSAEFQNVSDLLARWSKS
jgi:hypothetical protein